MKQLTSRLPCFSFTHSRWRGDFSRRALAQSWAGALKAPSSRATAISFVWFIVAFPLFAALSGGFNSSFLISDLFRISGFAGVVRPPSANATGRSGFRGETHHNVELRGQFADARGFDRSEIDGD